MRYPIMMLRTRNKNITTYYRHLKLLFSSIHYKEGKFLKDVKLQLQDFLIDHPSCTYQDIVNHLGTPEAVFIDYISHQDSTDIYKVLSIKRLFSFIKKTLFILGCIFAIIFFFFWWKGYQSFNDSSLYYYDIQINEGCTKS